MVWKPKTLWKLFIAVSLLWLSVLFYMGFVTIKWMVLDKPEYLPSGYVIHTPGCRIKDNIGLDEPPKSNQLLQFKGKDKGCNDPLTSISHDGEHIVRNQWINQIKKNYRFHGNWRDIECEYTPFQRVDDQRNSYGETKKFPLSKEIIKVKPFADYIRVKCFDGSENNFYTNYHLLARVNSLKWKGYKKKAYFEVFSRARQRMSVLILGIDGISLTNAKSRLPHTVEYLRSQPNCLEFKGYSNVGRSALSNILPILLGRKTMEKKFPEKFSNNEEDFRYNLDGEKFIWKHFKNRSYATVFAENSARESLFDRDRYEFEEQPTDYYLHPFLLEVEKQNEGNHVSMKDNCISGRPQSLMPLELAEKLLELYVNYDFFSFYWLSNSDNISRYEDIALTLALDEMKDYKIFKKTFVFVITNASKGNLDDKVQPLMFVLYPDSLPQWTLNNLKKNTRRLITPLDLHATLVDLANDQYDVFARVKRNNSEHPPQGISLFLPHNIWRTCKDVDIPEDLCICKDDGE